VDEMGKFFPRSGHKNWDSHSHGYHVALPLLHVPRQEGWGGFPRTARQPPRSPLFSRRTTLSPRKTAWRRS